MFNANELNLNFLKDISSEPQLVIIPVNNEYGVLAVVKSLGGGKAACIAFSPATRLDNPFQGYRPTFLRKMITTDFPMREGRWTPLEVKSSGAQTLRSAVTVLLRDFENINAATVKEVEMRRPTNASSSPEVSAVTYATPENVPFEKALSHIVGLEFTMARAIAKKQAELVASTVTAKATEASASTNTTEISNETQAEAQIENSATEAPANATSVATSAPQAQYQAAHASHASTGHHAAPNHQEEASTN